METEFYLDWDRDYNRVKKYRRNLRKEEKKKVKNLPENRPLITIDSEGVGGTGEVQRCTLLGAYSTISNQFRYLQGHSLSTDECFKFLLKLPDNALKLAFSFGYDVNMMLKDVDIKCLRRLRECGWTYWKKYRIAWVPGKTFTISAKHRTCTVWDVFGFFQKSFLAAITDWHIGTEQEREIIRVQKAARGTFVDQDENVTKYCMLECRLLAETIKRMFKVISELEISLTRYDGAGAIAAALMRKNNVKDYKKEPPEEARRAVISAYYGGRFENSVIGIVGEAYSYDINSAYPAICHTLPCLAHTDWEFTDGSSEPEEYGLYYVEWDVPHKYNWGPFPFRHKGNLSYPRNGKGWYWGAEVKAAKEIYPCYIRILRFWRLRRNCTHTPFGYIEQLYNLRREYKIKGDQAHLIYKLGYNANYGKLAQTLGYRGYFPDGTLPKPPVNQSFVWAGMITSGCRSKILDAIRLAPDSVISIATDGIFSNRRLDLDVGEGLGQWSFNKWDDLFLAQPGVYGGLKDNNPTYRTRGYHGAELNVIEDHDGGKENGWLTLQQLRNWWLDHRGAPFEIYQKRFVGIGYALAVNDLSIWRSWQEMPRILYFDPVRRRIHGRDWLEDRELIRTLPMNAPAEESEMYQLKAEWDGWQRNRLDAVLY